MAVLDGLIEAYPFKPYRNYRAFSRRRQNDIQRAEILGVLSKPGGFGFVDSAEKPCAAAIVQPAPWESAFFGMSMARFTHVLRGEDPAREAVREVSTAALQQARDRGIKHLSVRLDVGDLDTGQVLEDLGFRMMDVMATYIWHPKKATPPSFDLKRMGPLRLFKSEDTDQVLDITREAYQGFRGRYHLDPHFPPERSDQLYVEWARKCCSGEWASTMLITEDIQGEVKGWLSYAQIEPASTVGKLQVCGRGLAACRRDSPGAHAGLLWAACARIHASGALGETQTQISNNPVIHVYQALHGPHVRTDVTLHAWLG
jgi:hypothetical protein